MEMKRHKSYHTVKLLIDGNQIKEFHEIFDHIPKSVVYRDLGVNYHRYKSLMKRVQGFKLEELYALAHLVDVDEMTMVNLAHAEYQAHKPSSRQRKT